MQFDVAKHYKLFPSGCFVQLGHELPKENEIIVLKAPKKYVLAEIYATGEYSERGLVSTDVWQVFKLEKEEPSGSWTKGFDESETDLLISCRNPNDGPMDPTDVAEFIETTLGSLSKGAGTSSVQLSTVIGKKRDKDNVFRINQIYTKNIPEAHV